MTKRTDLLGSTGTPVSMPDDTICVFLMNPENGEPLRNADGSRAFVTLFSRGSRRARDYMLKDIRQNGLNAIGVGSDRRTLRMMAALTKNWNLPSFEGSQVSVPVSPDAAFELYSDGRLTWLRDQVGMAWIGEKAA